jgi:hypothetical protein
VPWYAAQPKTPSATTNARLVAWLGKTQLPQIVAAMASAAAITAPISAPTNTTRGPLAWGFADALRPAGFWFTSALFIGVFSASGGKSVVGNKLASGSNSASGRDDGVAVTAEAVRVISSEIPVSTPENVKSTDQKTIKDDAAPAAGNSQGEPATMAAELTAARAKANPTLEAPALEMVLNFYRFIW